MGINVARIAAPRRGIIYIVNHCSDAEILSVFEGFCQNGIDIVRDEYMWVEWRSAFMVLS